MDMKKLFTILAVLIATIATINAQTNYYWDPTGVSPAVGGSGTLEHFSSGSLAYTKY